MIFDSHKEFYKIRFFQDTFDTVIHVNLFLNIINDAINQVRTYVYFVILFF